MNKELKINYSKASFKKVLPYPPRDFCIELPERFNQNVLNMLVHIVNHYLKGNLKPKKIENFKVPYIKVSNCNGVRIYPSKKADSSLCKISFDSLNRAFVNDVYETKRRISMELSMVNLKIGHYHELIIANEPMV